MGTEKRQRQKQGHQARLEAARAAARREQRKRRVITVGIAAVVVVALLFAISWLGGNGDDDSTDVATDTPDITEPEVTVPDGPPPTELQTEDLVVGDGEEAQLGDQIEVHYTGVRFEDGEQFDSSWDGEPVTFPLVEGGLIEGWVQGIPGMRVGGRRQLVIPAELAYGESPEGGRPAGALVFVVDLIAIR